MTRNTQSEERAKRILEKMGFAVFRPSFPDFIIWNEEKKFGFVEIKRGFYDRCSLNQLVTLEVLRAFGLFAMRFDVDDAKTDDQIMHDWSGWIGELCLADDTSIKIQQTMERFAEDLRSELASKMSRNSSTLANVEKWLKGEVPKCTVRGKE
jgi:hypothetical protein